MNYLAQRIGKLINTIEETNILFYQQKNGEAYQKLLIIIDDLLVIVDTINNGISNHTYNLTDISLNGILEEVIRALEEKDPVLVADILQYELTEQLKEILKKI